MAISNYADVFETDALVRLLRGIFDRMDRIEEARRLGVLPF